MKTKSILTTAIILIASMSIINAQTNGTFTDSRDGKTYKTVKIGEQVWMAENLNHKTNGGCWAFENRIYYTGVYGYLYDWKTATNVCPEDYHLPSDKEWEQLAEYISNEKGPYLKEDNQWKTVGRLLKADKGWKGNQSNHSLPGNYKLANFYNFSALPGGSGNSNGEFYNTGYTGSWWSSTPADDSKAKYRYLDFRNDDLFVYPGVKDMRLSIRCIKD